MNQALVDNWNSVVGDEDTVYFLGDFAFGLLPQAKEIFSYLKGKRIILVRGNHCGGLDRMRQIGFHEVHDYLTIEYKNYKIALSHFPYRQFINPEKPRKYHKQYPEWQGEQILAHGHCHSFPENKTKFIEVCGRKIPQYDVGVDANQFTPVNLDTVLREIEKIC